MTRIDGAAAAQTMLEFRTWRAGYCLEAVWTAYKRNGARTDRSAPTAYVGWERSDDKHPGDRNPPAGVPVWWGPRKGSAAGDVVISLGGGRVVATDWPRNGVIGVTTIDARERQIGRPYLGWTGDILGVPIRLPAAPAAAGDKTPTPDTEEPDMSMQTIRHPNGTIFFADELGADHLGDYKSVDIDLGELIGVNARVFGPYEDVSAREFDIAVAIADRRWARKKAEIVADIVKALKE